FFITTVPKLIFNQILPQSFPYINQPTYSNIQQKTPHPFFLQKPEHLKPPIHKQQINPPFKKPILPKIIPQIFNTFHITQTSKILHPMKNLPFKYST
ncbi:hypothetical protein, partial [Bacillus altitudinis]|uniref:hypothetical protein n=1 Tax=Bacillus altitudinis TaxID=293387 RepID=UPI0011A60042